MLFGDRSDFAIEADVEPNLKPPNAVWGHMCVWCRGEAIGEINDRNCALYPAYCEFCGLATSLDRLWADELAGLDDVAAWNFLDGLLYGYHGDLPVSDTRSSAQCQSDALAWGRFNFLTNWGEQFDGCKAFIMCPSDGSVRIHFRRRPEHLARTVQVSRNGFVVAINEFTRWFEEQAARLHSWS